MGNEETSNWLLSDISKVLEGQCGDVFASRWVRGNNERFSLSLHTATNISSYIFTISSTIFSADQTVVTIDLRTNTPWT